MKIGELAQISGVPAHTIRFYESKGLLPMTIRGSNRYRLYDKDSIERLERIACAKRLGFSIEEMRLLFAEEERAEGVDHDVILSHLDSRMEQVNEMIKQLEKQKIEIRQFKKLLTEHWEKGQCLQVAGLSQKK